MIQILTIEREYGCGAAAIAEKLAARLGWTLWDRNITEQIARRLKCSVSKVEQREEKLDPAYYRLMKVFMRGSYEDSMGAAGVELLDAEHLARLFERVIHDAAGNGRCVFVGRGAPWFLRGRSDTMHVFLFAPHEEKMRRVQERGVPEREAEELIERVDQERAAFIKRHFGRAWPQRDLYHMMLNTIIGDDAVLEIVLHEMEILGRSAVSWQPDEPANVRA